LKKLRVGVVYGGRSGEHEVSIASAAAVMANLDRARYEAVPIRIDRDGRWSLADKPDVAIVELGSNDMLRGYDPAITGAALDQIMAKLSQRGIPTLIAGMLASPNLGPAYKARFDPLYPDLAAKWNAMLYPFFLEGVAADSGLLQSDMLHPNAKGVARIVDRMLPSVERLIAEAEKR